MNSNDLTKSPRRTDRRPSKKTDKSDDVGDQPASDGPPPGGADDVSKSEAPETQSATTELGAHPDLTTETAAKTPAATAPDPFDPETLRLSQDFAAMANVEQVLNTVPVRKPGRQDFVRTHSDPAYRLVTTTLVLEDGSETYLIAPGMRNHLLGEYKPVELVTAIMRQGTVFLWPLKLPDDTGRSNSWNDSARYAADVAQEKWVRVSSDMSLGAYRVFVASGELAEPEWPDVPMRDLLEIAFRGRIIDSPDHPVLRSLRGEQ
jgi:hypothetical protein